MSGPTSSHARSDFDKAKACWRRWLYVQAVTPVLGVLAALMPDWKLVAVSAPLLAFLLMYVAFYLRGQADEHFETADGIRRSDLLRNGLGIEPPVEALVRQLSETVSTKAAPTPNASGQYYNSPLPTGTRRLAHILAESAHFTATLAKHTARLCSMVGILGGGVVLILAYLVLSLVPKSAPPTGSSVSLLQQNASGIAAACMAMASFFVLGTFTELWRNFRSLAAVAEATRSRCLGLLDQPDIELARLLAELEPYNCAVARSAPIPTFVWDKYKVKLTEAWAEISARVRV